MLTIHPRSGSARVFIVSTEHGFHLLPLQIKSPPFQGHATGQTTGLGGHMAARFIPTVERESIDLM
jgi:hypothetical protein